jgi:hypothetical protein
MSLRDRFLQILADAAAPSALYLYLYLRGHVSGYSAILTVLVLVGLQQLPKKGLRRDVMIASLIAVGGLALYLIDEVPLAIIPIYVVAFIVLDRLLRFLWVWWSKPEQSL